MYNRRASKGPQELSRRLLIRNEIHDAFPPIYGKRVTTLSHRIVAQLQLQLQFRREHDQVSIACESVSSASPAPTHSMNDLFRTMPFPASRSALHIESGQAAFRLLVVCVFILYALVAVFFLPLKPNVPLLVLLGVYFCFALGWMFVCSHAVFRLKSRLNASILVDQATIASAMLIGGEFLAPVWWAPISVSIGCGLVGGIYYAKLASLLGAGMVALACMLSPYWQGVPLLSIGVVLAILVIPWQAALVSEQIARGRKELQRRAQALETASKTDSLTGVLNRAGFDEALACVLKDTNTICAVMLLDLDGFKAVNDAAGHQAGDELLRLVAQRISHSLRDSDRIARIGGDEFGILACGLHAADDAEWLACKVLQAIAAVCIPGHAGLRITGSLGICIHPDACMTTPALVMERADRLMYDAKRAGKNQYRTSFDPKRPRRKASDAA